jgi:uncharacterized protein YcfL
MRLLCLIFLSSFFLVHCTSSKWTVVDLYSTEHGEEPVKVDSDYILVVNSDATVSNPILELSPYEIADFEYVQRVLVERTVQNYRPRWGFALLSGFGAAISIYAGNSSRFINNPSTTQQIALTSTGVLLSLLAISNMKPVSDPIFTGEKRYLRRSGSEIRPDTLQAQQVNNAKAIVTLLYNGDELIASKEFYSENGLIKIDLAESFNGINIEGEEVDSIYLVAEYESQTYEYDIPLSSFMDPYFIVENSVTELRTAPNMNELNILTEVGRGSELPFIQNYDDRWYNVRFGSSETFIDKRSGSINWKTSRSGMGSTLIEVEEVPFGQIDVENSLPVLKSRNPADRAILISNIQNNQIDDRRYSERDLRLFAHYMQNSFSMEMNQINQIQTSDEEILSTRLNNISTTDSSNVYIYISGFGRVDQDNNQSEIVLVNVDDDGNESTLNLNTLATYLQSVSSKSIIIFADIEFQHEYNQSSVMDNGNVSVYLNFVNKILSAQPNSAIIFGSKPNQSSRLYAGNQNDYKRHYIFNYYIAQALQQRRTRVFDLVRHLENNVDYTSRRLYDRPQEIVSFGNLTLNLASE